MRQDISTSAGASPRRGGSSRVAAALAVLTLAATAAACGAGDSPAGPSAPATPTVRPDQSRPLVEQVVDGGFVLFFRHSARDASAMPTALLAAVDNAGECRPGSELTSSGIADAEALGQAFARRGIRVEHVYASPACRAVQMARLAFGDGFETTRALSWLGMWSEGEGQALAPLLRALLSTPPARGQNVVLISHNDVLEADRVGMDVTLDQSEAAVFKPQGRHAFALVGRLRLDEWLR